MEIKIGKGSRHCSACKHEFIHEESLLSLVRVVEGALQREDYCANCRDVVEPIGAFSKWSARYIDPKVAEEQPPEVFSPLRQVFYEAAESQDRCELAKAYLAAQLLRRQKAFRLIKESDDADGELRVALFADRIGNKLIEVRDPNLTHAEMESGRRALLERLTQLENPADIAEEKPDDGYAKEA